MRKKLYFIKREVIATTLKRALELKGEIINADLADEKYWPEEIKKRAGFKKKS